MDVGTIANLSSQNVAQYATQNKNVANAKSAYAANSTATAESTSATSVIGDAYDVNISDAAKAAQQKAETETVDDAAENTKGLSADQVRALQDSIQVSQQTMLNMMIQSLQDSNDKLQGWLDEGIGILNFDGVQIDASQFALPEVATNAEDAAKAVADGGEWSVDSVATRIFDLANTIAGGDPDKLAKMRSAVEDGFKQAGVAWSNATGLDEMPEITSKTYDEIMSRFDKRAEEISGTSAVE